jgi:hypothetical protein
VFQADDPAHFRKLGDVPVEPRFLNMAVTDSFQLQDEPARWAKVLVVERLLIALGSVLLTCVAACAQDNFEIQVDFHNHHHILY